MGNTNHTVTDLVSAVRASLLGGGRALSPWLLWSPLVIVLVLVIYTLDLNLPPAEEGETQLGRWSIFAVGMVTIAAALIAGIAVGFLFGLPKAVEQADVTGFLRTNSNLEKVSDWLTTILIGLGLVQLGAVAGGVDDLSESIAPGLGGGSGAETVAVCLLIYAAVDGFLIGYLWTRIVVSLSFNEVARELTRKEETAATPPPSKPPAESPPPPPPSTTPPPPPPPTTPPPPRPR